MHNLGPALLEAIREAEVRHLALGHFNISTLVLLEAVATAARELGAPVVIGVSEGERDFLGIRQTVALVAALREEQGFPIFLNADHTYSIARAEEAARAGFDMIVFDGSKLAFEENARQTRRAVEAVKAINPGIVVEAELGYIGSGSQIHDSEPETGEAITLTTPEEARQFVAATGVDVLAPAVGNRHGLLRRMLEGTVRKHLDIDRISSIRQAAGIPLTLHGGSGTDDDDFRRAIQAGIAVIHINTELRLAWRRGLEAALAQAPDEVVPYKLLPSVKESVEKVVRARLQLFNTSP
jgi:fructose-bisphosphate aldolase class II